MMAGKSLDERSVDTYRGRAEAGRTCERRKSRHGSWRSARKRPVESDRQLTHTDAGHLVESVGATSTPSNRSNRRLRSARMACLPTRGSTNMTNGMYVVQKIITKAIFFTGHKVIRAEAMIVGRICLFVLAENFFFVGAIWDCFHSESAGVYLLRGFAWPHALGSRSSPTRLLELTASLFAVVAPAPSGPPARSSQRYVPSVRSRNDSRL
jgi:hypothetical protein